MTPSAFIFLYELQLFLTFRNRSVAVWNFRGELVTSFEDHLLWHPDCNTSNIYITSEQDLIISYCKADSTDSSSEENGKHLFLFIFFLNSLLIYCSIAHAFLRHTCCILLVMRFWFPLQFFYYQLDRISCATQIELFELQLVSHDLIFSCILMMVICLFIVTCILFILINWSLRWNPLPFSLQYDSDKL